MLVESNVPRYLVRRRLRARLLFAFGKCNNSVVLPRLEINDPKELELGSDMSDVV